MTAKPSNPTVRVHQLQLFLVVGLLLLMTASRLPRFNTQEFESDEVWTIWQTVGTPAQILDWTPYDWTPLHYLTLGVWRGFTGLEPFTVRLFSFYVFLIGAALVYRVAKRLSNRNAALLGLAVFGAMGYMIYLSILIRGYIVITALMPLALLLTMNYFERPTGWRGIGRGILVGLCLAAMFYTHLTSVIAFVFLGIYSLIFHWRSIWRWIVPGITGLLLALPEIIKTYQLVISRVKITAQIDQAPFSKAIGDLLSDYGGRWAIPMVIALFVATVLLLRQRTRWKDRRIILVAAWLLIPVLVYLANSVLDFFDPRHLAWVMIGISIWIGWGLSLTPRPVRIGVIVAAVIAMFAPIDSYSKYLVDAPYMATFPVLAQQVHQGDVFVIDPNEKEGTPEDWDYFTRAYFPNGLQIVSNPTGYRRVWYLKVDGRQDKATEAAIKNNRIEEQFVGPWDFLFRLYEAPPDVTGILFENGLRFHGADIIGEDVRSFPVFRKSQPIHIRLWWTVDRPPTLDYSESLKLYDANNHLILQDDGAPLIPDAAQTSQWKPNQLYVEDRILTLPDNVITGAYPLYLTTYYYSDPAKPFQAPGVDANGLLQIASIKIKAW